MSEILFIVCPLVVVIGYLVFRFKLNLGGMKDYFMTRTGKGILKGIFLVLIIGLLIVMSSLLRAEDEGRWFNWAEMYVGIDRTKNISPMCEEEGIDYYQTSNAGFRLNVYENDRFSANTKYTHHSCAYSPDNASYDAIGVEFNYRFWSRN